MACYDYKDIKQKGKNGSFVFGELQSDLRSSYQSNFIKNASDWRNRQKSMNARFASNPKDLSFCDLVGHQTDEPEVEKVEQKKKNTTNQEFVPQYKTLTSKQRRDIELFGQVQKIAQQVNNVPQQTKQPQKQILKNFKKKSCDLRQESCKQVYKSDKNIEKIHFNLYKSEVFNTEPGKYDIQNGIKMNSMKQNLHNNQDQDKVKEKEDKSKPQKFNKKSNNPENPLISQQTNWMHLQYQSKYPNQENKESAQDKLIRNIYSIPRNKEVIHSQVDRQDTEESSSNYDLLSKSFSQVRKVENSQVRIFELEVNNLPQNADNKWFREILPSHVSLVDVKLKNEDNISHKSSGQATLKFRSNADNNEQAQETLYSNLYKKGIKMSEKPLQEKMLASTLNWDQVDSSKEIKQNFSPDQLKQKVMQGNEEFSMVQQGLRQIRQSYDWNERQNQSRLENKAYFDISQSSKYLQKNNNQSKDNSMSFSNTASRRQLLKKKLLEPSRKSRNEQLNFQFERKNLNGKKIAQKEQ